MSQYATPTDLTTLGINPLALQGISNAEQVAACISASSEADGYLVDRYPPPYSAPYPQMLVQQVAYIAVYRLLTQRGYNPSAGADSRIAENYWGATYNPQTGVHGWLSRVKRQEISIPDLLYTKALYPLYAVPSVRTGGPSANQIRGWTSRGCR
jgi:phage gp36-like protein